MRRLRKIMNQNVNYDERVKKLNEYAKELGISITQSVITDNQGKRYIARSDEDLLYEKICQYLTMQNNQKIYWIALISAIASMSSAITAWFAVVLNRP